MQKQTQFHRTLMRMVLIALLSALTFALSRISISLGALARLHLGNVMCLLSGLLFGPMIGGLSAGIGSMLYDFTDPRFISEFWITFIMKFVMSFVAGALYRYALRAVPSKPRMAISALIGSLTYSVLYLSKTAIMQHFLQNVAWVNMPATLALPALSSLINGPISVVASVALCAVLQPALRRAGIFKDIMDKPTPAA